MRQALEDGLLQFWKKSARLYRKTNEAMKRSCLQFPQAGNQSIAPRCKERLLEVVIIDREQMLPERSFSLLLDSVEMGRFLLQLLLHIRHGLPRKECHQHVLIQEIGSAT